MAIIAFLAAAPASAQPLKSQLAGLRPEPATAMPFLMVGGGYDSTLRASARAAVVYEHDSWPSDLTGLPLIYAEATGGPRRRSRHRRV